MKVKGHIIAKIVLSVVLSLTFVLLGHMMKNVPEQNVIKQHEKTLTMPTTTFFDRLDRNLELLSDKLYYGIKETNTVSLVVYCVLVSVIIVLFLDLTAGVGRSRSEERMKKNIVEE
jgi:uncharacterized membrane protein